MNGCREASECPTILVAEDEERIGELIRELLEDSGCNVLLSNNGRSALDLVETYPGQIDLLVTDVDMPEMDGPDLARNMLQKFPKMRVVFVSGYIDITDTGVNLCDPAVVFLTKPFSVDTFLNTIQMGLRGNYGAVSF